LPADVFLSLSIRVIERVLHKCFIGNIARRAELRKQGKIAVDLFHRDVADLELLDTQCLSFSPIARQGFERADCSVIDYSFYNSANLPQQTIPNELYSGGGRIGIPNPDPPEHWHSPL